MRRKLPTSAPSRERRPGIGQRNRRTGSRDRRDFWPFLHRQGPLSPCRLSGPRRHGSDGCLSRRRPIGRSRDTGAKNNESLRPSPGSGSRKMRRARSWRSRPQDASCERTRRPLRTNVPIRRRIRGSLHHLRLSIVAKQCLWRLLRAAFLDSAREVSALPRTLK